MFGVENTLRCCHREWTVCGSDILVHSDPTGPTFPLEGDKAEHSPLTVFIAAVLYPEP